MLSVAAPSRQTVTSEPSWALDKVISTILVDVEVVKGVAKTDTGLAARGTTVTEVGAVVVKESFTAGKALDDGITASVTPLENVATCELLTDPAVMVAVFELDEFDELDELELLTSGTAFEGLELLDAPIALIATTRKV